MWSVLGTLGMMGVSVMSGRRSGHNPDVATGARVWFQRAAQWECFHANDLVRGIGLFLFDAGRPEQGVAHEAMCSAD